MIRLTFAVIYILNVCLGQDFLEPSQSHLAVCYNDTRYTLHHQQLPFSLDNLLAIIERIENHYSFTSSPARDIAAYLLKRFRVDGVKSEKYGHEESIQYTLDAEEHKRGNAILKIVSQNHFQHAPVDFLTNDETCALHWMLSHSINETRMHEEDDINWRPATPSPRKRRQVYLQERSEFSRYPREMGVIYTPSGEAVAVGSVLAGIAMMKDSSTIRIGDVDSNIGSISGVNDLTISKLDAVTYAINLALDATKKKYDLGPRGIWNDSICPTEYTLNSHATSITDALLFGSFDGFFIGKSAAVKAYSESILLSQILRMYYGDGFKNDRDNRACNRIAQFKGILEDSVQSNRIIEEVTRGIIILGYSVGGIKSEGKAAEGATRLVDNIRKNYTSGNFNFPSQQKCEVLASNSETKIYPLIDLYVIIDSVYFQSQSRYNEMAAFVTNVASFLDISTNKSHIGLYVENKNLFDSFMPLNESLSVAEWKCKVQNFDRTNMRIIGHGEQTVETIRALKQMLIDRKTHNRNREIAGRPGEVVLFFRSSGVANSEEVIWEMEHFRKDHPEVTVIGAARNRGEVEPFIGKNLNGQGKTKPEDFLQLLSGSTMQMYGMADKFFKNYLRRVGATIYYPYCERDTRSSHDVSGFLRPFASQFHTMPSAMFNLSKELKIDVRAQGVALKACISRDFNLFKQSNIRPNDPNCMDILGTSGSPNPMFIGDPCTDHPAGYCPPFYIRVERKDPTESGECYTRAGENLCRTFDDVRYTIRLENGRCSGCIAKMTISLLILCVISSVLNSF